MKIAVYGGTQGIGRCVVEQALEQKHSVSLLARTPSKLMLRNPNLSIVEGNVLDPVAVAQVAEGQDVVICSLGLTTDNPDDLCTQGTKLIMAAMKEKGIRRLIVVTALGTADSYDQVSFFFKGIIATVLKKAYTDKNTQEAAVRASDLDWIIVRPGGLSDQPANGKYHFGTDKSIRGDNQVSRADVADFILKQLTSTEFVRQAVGIAGR